MFDLISGGERHPFHDQTAAPVVISVIGHAVVVAAVVVLPLMFATSRLPIVPTMMAFVAAPPAPPAASAPASARASGCQACSRAGGEAAGRTGEPERGAARGARYGAPGAADAGVARWRRRRRGRHRRGSRRRHRRRADCGAAATTPASSSTASARADAAGSCRRTDTGVPKLVKRVEPIYPDFAIAADVTGMVILEAIVDGSGSVQSVRVLRSVKVLDTAAVDAVKQWRYEPLVLNGVTTPFILTVTLTFAIK